MSDFNPREPIRLSDIDNLLEDSIFTSSNGVKLAEYLRKKRGTTGRVKLQNIFDRVAANIPKPIFNFDLDSSDPNPLPESPQQPTAATNDDAAAAAAESAPIAGTSAPVQNGNDVIGVASASRPGPVLTPLVVVQDLKLAPSPKAKSSDPGVSNLNRQALLNQYHRTNMAKCELLRQITSSTPKPDAALSLSRISTFTTSISPITEAGSPRISEPGSVVPQAAPPPPMEIPMPVPIALLQVPAAPVLPVDTVLPPEILAPCSQAPPAERTPRKVIVVSTPAVVPAPAASPKMIIPETPSPVKEVAESPRVAPHQMLLPRRLSATFNNVQEQQANESNLNITSDESEPVEAEQLVERERLVEQDQPVERERLVEQDRPVEQKQSAEEGQLVNQDHLEEQSEHGEPVNQDESVDHQEQPVARNVSLPQENAESSIITKSILKDSFSSSQKKRHSYRVSFSQHLVQQREISPAPSIPEAHYSSSSDDDDSSDHSDDEEDFDEDGEYHVVDEVYSDDGECDPNDIEANYNELVRGDELEKRLAEIHDRIPSPLIDVVDEAPVQWYETRTPRSQQGDHIAPIYPRDKLLAPATCTKDNKTDLQLVDIITDWDDEDDDEDVDKEDKEQQSPPKESQPPPPIDIPETQQSTQSNNETICNAMDISTMEDSAERLVELPPPPASICNGTVEGNRLSSPSRAITPPSQFTDSAKRRFLRDNDDALISRLQNELPPPSQPPPSPPATPERVSETLMDIVQSFRDQPPPPPMVTTASRKTIIPIKKPRSRSIADPGTTSYFEAVVEPFAHPTAPPPTTKPTKAKPLTTAQKRKLYASSNGVVQPVQANGAVVDSSATLRNIRVIVQKLRVDNYPEMLTASDRAAIERANNAKPNELQSNTVGAKGTGKKTEEHTKAGSNGQEEQSQKAQPVREGEEAVDQLDKGGSDTHSDNSEPPFSGFDEQQDLERHPELLREADKVLGTETELPRVQNAAPPEVRSKRVISRTTARRKNPTSTVEQPNTNPVDTIDEPTSERSEEHSDERLNPGAVEDPQPASLPEVPNTESVDQDREEVRSKRVTRKKINAKTKELSNPAEKIVEPPVERVVELSNERLISNDAQVPLDTEGEGRRANGKKKNGNPAKQSAEPTVLERADEHSDERLTPNEVPDPPVVEVKGRTTARRKNPTSTVEPNTDPADTIDEPTSSERSEEHSDERLNPGAVQDPQPASLPEVPNTESVDQDSEEERIISRTPLDAVDVLPLKTQPRKRGRSRNVNPTVEPAAARTIPEANSKNVVQQSNEADTVEAEGSSQSGTPETLSSASSELMVEKDAQSLPFKKRKGRMYDDDEPPALEPFGGAAPVDSSDSIPPLLAPNDPAPSTSKRQKDQTKARDYYEKHTTEKPEKKLSRFYQDVEDADETWVPHKKTLKDRYNRQVRKKVDTVAGPRTRQRGAPPEEDPEPIEEVRRSTRTRRLAQTVVKGNPNVKSIYDKPNYRQITDEEIMELTKQARKQAEEKRRKRAAKPKTTDSSDSTNVAAPNSRKRLQEDLEEPTTSKRNRPDDDRVIVIADEQPLAVDPSASATDTSDRTLSAEKMQAYSWMIKLMQPNNVPCEGLNPGMTQYHHQYQHYSQENLSCRELNGIQYSFYLHCDAENYGFLRFAPSAAKKLTKTRKFLLKFLILEGNLTFQLNGTKIKVKGGDFLILPECSTYGIENGQEVSLIFMIKTKSVAV